LNEHRVKYLVVGAYAVSIHAQPRATKDLDILIKADTANARKVFAALARFGAPLQSMSAAVLGGLADVERDLIRTRTAEGRSWAKARGQHMGRPPKLTPQQQAEARRRRAEGATLKELTKNYNVGVATIARLSA